MSGVPNSQEREDAARHVHYEDLPSSASDDDSKAVEVTFDPSNPYRRKSSLVSSEAVPPKIRRRSKESMSSQCLVHQFLDGHRPGPARGGHKRSPSDHADHKHEDVSKEVGLDGIVEPKGKTQSEKPANPFEPDSGNSSEAGQFDQISWKSAVAKGKTEANVIEEEHDGLHSRLLTKRQLTDMAWGVRELSRRLGSVRLKFRAHSIFLLTKAYDRELIPKTRELAKWLLSKDRDVQYTVYVQDILKDNKDFNSSGLLKEVEQEYRDSKTGDQATLTEAIGRRLRFWDENMCRTRPHTFDFVITLGGDGTVLYASWLFQRIVPPVLSFSLGSLGFLTKFDFNEFPEILNRSFNDGVSVSLRLRFEGTVMRSQKQRVAGNDGTVTPPKRDLVEELIGEEREDEHTHSPDGTYEILNEIVVDRGPNPTMSFTEIFGDDEHFTTVLADGVCVSTPTGSTAYNLAAGGSLCHPENPVMLVSSICAHTLSFRPIILPDTIVLRIGVPYDARTGSWASFDGRERIELHPGDYVTISASRFPFASVQPQGRRSEDWVNSISAKLGWNTRQKQKNEGYKPW
ncbi:ATP-NAD kinase [Xylariomycetidae sp. FL0641]|nr:ATP-NAD kinase [Xylariomycetidae sp. FL0641]